MVVLQGLRGVTQYLSAVSLGLLCLAVTCQCDRHVFPVTLKMPHNHEQTCTFPDSFYAEIRSTGSFPEFLVLHRKDVIDTDPPAYVIKRRQTGALNFDPIERGIKTTAAYQNEENGAAFLLKCSPTGMEIAGTFYQDGKKYRVRRIDSQDKSWSAQNSNFAREKRADFYEFVLARDTPHFDQYGRATWKYSSSSGLQADLHSQDTRSDTLPNARAKRQAKDYYLDVLVALDFAFYSYWLRQANNNNETAIQKAKEYMAYIFNGINSRFNSAKTAQYNLHVTISGFIIALSAEAATWTETAKQTSSSGVTQLNADTVMSKLETYVKDNYQDLPTHDHFMLITEYDLYGDDNGFRFNNTAGKAYINTMCNTNGQSISVVEDHGGFQSEGTATHELGHSMGARHDGENNRCSSADRYVMAGGVEQETEANKANPWKFSSCSVEAFKTRIQELIANNLETSCLLNHVTAYGVPAVSGLPGQSLGPDDQCRQIYGPESYLCRGSSFGQAADICSSMYCRNPSTKSSCTLNTAAEGTCCGNRKWCSGGQCVGSNDADCYISDTCPFGQRSGVILDNRTCDELESAYCYLESPRKMCCEMCDRAVTGVYGCEYGDKLPGCFAKFCGGRTPNGSLYDIDCCGTCGYRPTTLTPVVTSPTTTTTQPTTDGCRDSALPGGDTCSSLLDRDGLALCCNPGNKRTCCKSCEDRKSSDPLCPYGDCADCTALKTRPVPCNQTQRDKCCQTCKDVDDRLSNQASSTSRTVPPATTKTSTAKATSRTTKKQTGTTLQPAIATVRTTRAPSETNVKPEKECKPLLGVKTCGATDIRRDVIVLLLSLTVSGVLVW